MEDARNRAELQQEIQNIVEELLARDGVKEVCVYGSALRFVRGESDKIPHDVDIWVWAEEAMPDEVALAIIDEYPEKFDIKLAEDRQWLPDLVPFVDRYSIDDQRFMSIDAFEGMECFKREKP